MIVFLCVKTDENRKHVGSHLYKMYNKAKIFWVSGWNRRIQTIWDTAAIIATEPMLFWLLSVRNLSFVFLVGFHFGGGGGVVYLFIWNFNFWMETTGLIFIFVRFGTKGSSCFKFWSCLPEQLSSVSSANTWSSFPTNMKRVPFWHQ